MFAVKHDIAAFTMSPELENLIRAFSRLLGWIYTLCWSASFYPQLIDNFRRRSTTGLAIDYPTINVVGFACYTIYTSTFLYSPAIRHQYALRHPLSEEPTVRFNDFAFSVHALLITALTYSQFYPQIWGLTVSRHQKASKTMKGIFFGCVSLVGAVICIVLGANPNGGHNPDTWAWIDVIYTISYLKLFITVVKYIPQAWLNFKRKSTENWRIEMILLDFSGGVLSLAQLFIDSSFNQDWSGLTGNPAKLLLSNISILFDLFFMVQHYILYTDPKKKQDTQEDTQEDPSVVTPLLAEPEAGYSSLNDANTRV